MIATKSDPTSEFETFGPYEVYERLGVGGMATVHRAKECGIEGFERMVALKRLLPHLAEDESFVRSFIREAKLASKLQHANIVQVYQLARVNSTYFIAMEYIEGRDVREILRQARKITGPPPMSVFISLMFQLCDALDYAHRRSDENGNPMGLVHRDVSPSNLLVDSSGHLKVIDFGIAKAQTQQGTQTGRVKGKLAYMAPEALKGENLDSRSDVFSAGVVAHELLTARPLFASKNEYQTLVRVQQGPIDPPSKHNRKCPPELDAIVLRALDRDRSQRWQSAADFRDALDHLRIQYQVSATNREVSSWLEWAFALRAPQTGSFSAISSASPPRTGSGSFPAVSPARAFARASSSITPAAADGLAEDTGKTGEHRIGGGDASKADTSVEPLPPPPGGLLAFQGSAGATDGTGATAAAALDDVDERAIEFAWGGRERPKSNPALLDEVPDVSAVSVEALARTGDIDAGAEADVAVVTTRFKPDALLADSQHSELYDCIEVVAPSDDDDSEDDSDSSMTAVAKLSGQSAAAASTSADGGVGAGLIAERGRRRGRFATIGGLVAFAALAAVLVLFMMRGDGVQAPAAALSAAPSAAIKFIVEPADATIAVLGYGEHSGAPHKLQVAAPGTYRVEISRDGYRSYVTELEVGSGENHVVRVYLEQGGKDSSQVTIRLRSDDWRVMLDGKRLPGTSPLIVEVATGTHTLSVLDDDGDEVWRNEFDAVANTNYEFEPQVERKRRRKKDRDNSEKQPDVEIHDQVAIAEPVVPDAQADKPDAGVFAALDTTTRSALPDLPKTEPPPAPKQRPQKATILANKVKKVAGPKLDLDLRGESYSGRASAKLCIDVTGKVSSVTVLSKLPSRVKDSLARNLRQWRYTPYVSEGQPTPACFAVHFRIEN